MELQGAVDGHSESVGLMVTVPAACCRPDCLSRTTGFNVQGGRYRDLQFPTDCC